MAPIYNYKCNYCSREWEEVLPEEQKLAPTKVMQPEECDIFVAPHAGLAKCDVELVEIHTNTSQSDTLQVKSPIPSLFCPHFVHTLMLCPHLSTPFSGLSH